MIWFWFALAVVLVVVELSTTQLVSIWLAASAAVTAVITAIFPALGIQWQILIFVFLSAVLLVSTRRFVKKFMKRTKDQETNLELYIDKVVIVTEEIDNIKDTGAVKMNGIIWSARSTDGSVIPKDEYAVVKKIQGNKVIVARKENK
ncbi:MAG: NfeD family protein [Eubacteriales bacterium]